MKRFTHKLLLSATLLMPSIHCMNEKDCQKLPQEQNSPYGAQAIVLYNPDTIKTITQSSDNERSLLHARLEQPLPHIQGVTTNPYGKVSSIAYTPDGPQIVTDAGPQGDYRNRETSIRLFERFAQQQRDYREKSIGLQNEAVTSVAISSHDSKLVLKGGTNDPYETQFIPKGNIVLTGSNDSTARIEMDNYWGRKVQRLQEYREKSIRILNEVVTSVAISSHDSKLILTGSNDCIVRLWNFMTGEIVMTLTHPSKVKTVAFSPDGKKIVTGCCNGEVRLWDISTQEQLFLIDILPVNLKGESIIVPSVTLVAFSADGKTILIGSKENCGCGYRCWLTPQRFDATTGERLEGGDITVKWPFKILAFSPDGNTALFRSKKSEFSGKNPLGIWDLKTGKLIKELETWQSATCALFSAEGTKVIVGSKSGNVCIWDIETETKLTELEEGTGRVTSLALSPNEKTILTISKTQKAKLWDLETKKLVLTLQKPTESIQSPVLFSHDGEIIIAGDGKKTLLWNSRTGEVMHALTPQQK